MGAIARRSNSVNNRFPIRLVTTFALAAIVFIAGVAAALIESGRSSNSTSRFQGGGLASLSFNGRRTGTVGRAAWLRRAEPRPGPRTPGSARGDDGRSAGGEPGIVFAAGDVARCGRRSRTQRIMSLLPAAMNPTERQFGVPTGANATAKLLSGKAGIILGLGDLAYSRGELLEYQKCFDPSWGAFKDRIYPVPGNHDYRTGAKGYFAYWGSKSGPESLGFYSFDYAGWHIVGLNSEINAELGSLQLTWLEVDLARQSSPCILAFFHRPAFSGTRREDATTPRRLFDLLYQYGATLVLSGHNHFYERTGPLNPLGVRQEGRGLRQFTVGTGGAPLKTPDGPASFTEALVAHKWGVLRLELYPGRYSWRFVTTPDGDIADRGEDTCVTRHGRSKAAAAD